MQWISTPDSPGIEGFGYDAARQQLEVTFKHGKTYTYFKVPETVFDQLQAEAAPSKGHFVNEHVKRVYEFQDKRDVGRAKRDLMRPHVRARYTRE